MALVHFQTYTIGWCQSLVIYLNTSKMQKQMHKWKLGITNWKTPNQKKKFLFLRKETFLSI